MSKRPSKKTTPGLRYTTRELLRDLFVFLKPYRKTLVLATVERFVGDVAGLYPHFALASLVTFISVWHQGEPTTPVFWWISTWFAAVLLRQFVIYFAKTRGFAAAEQASLGACESSMEQLFRLDIAWHERENAGNKLKRINNGSLGITRLVRIWIGNIIEIVVTLVGVMIILATVDPFITYATLAFLAIYVPVSTSLRRASSRAAREVNAADENLNGAMFESINNVRTAKVLDLAPALLSVIRTAAAKTYSKVRVRIMLYQTTNATQGILSASFRLLTIGYIINGIFLGRFEVGFLLLFHGYFNRLTDAAAEMSEVAQDAAIAKHSMFRMMELYRAPVVDPGTRDFPSDWKTISLKKVSYSYGGHNVLRNISFDIHRGERLGVVGLSGAGKTTLFKLLLKELEDYSGQILVDGVPLRDIRKQSFYRHAAVVLQDTEVFNFSLRKNITVAGGRGSREPSSLKVALDTAHVTDFISRLPAGIESIIGEKGVKLSGGERQRVGIARAVFKQPDILFLDEATSHLDLESEEMIRNSLHAFFKKVTAVVIAHRLTTIKEMDRIIVLEKGKLIEQGSFDELYRSRGRFYQLWEKQKLG